MNMYFALIDLWMNCKLDPRGNDSDEHNAYADQSNNDQKQGQIQKDLIVLILYILANKQSLYKRWTQKKIKNKVIPSYINPFN